MDRFADFNHYDPSQTRNVKEIPYADKLRGNGLTVITQGEKEFNAAIAGRPCLAVFFASWFVNYFFSILVLISSLIYLNLGVAIGESN